MKDYATLTLPLYELEVELKTPLTSLRGTRSDGTPYWSEACERSFKGIKQALCTAPCLIFPDFQKPMIMITDCNAKQLCGIRMQIDGSGVERPIGFHSRQLNKAELNFKRYAQVPPSPQTNLAKMRPDALPASPASHFNHEH